MSWRRSLQCPVCWGPYKRRARPGAGIFVNDILDAVPIDKYFELFKPGAGGEGGYIRISINFVKDLKDLDKATGARLPGPECPHCADWGCWHGRCCRSSCAWLGVDDTLHCAANTTCAERHRCSVMRGACHACLCPSRAPS